MHDDAWYGQIIDFTLKYIDETIWRSLSKLSELKLYARKSRISMVSIIISFQQKLVPAFMVADERVPENHYFIKRGGRLELGIFRNYCVVQYYNYNNYRYTRIYHPYTCRWKEMPQNNVDRGCLKKDGHTKKPGKESLLN